MPAMVVSNCFSKCHSPVIGTSFVHDRKSFARPDVVEICIAGFPLVVSDFGDTRAAREAKCLSRLEPQYPHICGDANGSSPIQTHPAPCQGLHKRRFLPYGFRIQGDRPRCLWSL